jgi:hypothetical protein
MARKSDGGFSQETEDAAVNRVCERLAEKDLLGVTLGGASAKDRKLIEDSLERHAARQRKAGKPGW